MIHLYMFKFCQNQKNTQNYMHQEEPEKSSIKCSQKHQGTQLSAIDQHEAIHDLPSPRFILG